MKWSGILAYYIDLPFVIRDGESIEEAINDVKSAFGCYLLAIMKQNRSNYILTSRRMCSFRCEKAIIFNSPINS